MPNPAAAELPPPGCNAFLGNGACPWVSHLGRLDVWPAIPNGKADGEGSEGDEEEFEAELKEFGRKNEGL